MKEFCSKDGRRWLRYFGSAEEAHVFALTAEPGHREEVNMHTSPGMGSGHRMSWFGRDDINSLEDARLAYQKRWEPGWLIFQRALRQVAGVNLPRPRNIRRKRRWNEIEGDEISLSRLWQGEPAFIQTAREAGGILSGGSGYATIAWDSGTPAGWTADQMCWRGVCAMVCADLLEEAGYRVRLLQTKAHTDLFQGLVTAKNYLGVTQVKGWEEPFNAASVANECWGWTYRTLGWMASHRKGVSFSSGMGSPDTVNNVPLSEYWDELMGKEDTVLQIKSSNCTSLEGCVKQARWILEEFAGKGGLVTC